MILTKIFLCLLVIIGVFFIGKKYGEYTIIVGFCTISEEKLYEIFRKILKARRLKKH